MPLPLTQEEKELARLSGVSEAVCMAVKKRARFLFLWWD